jgi:hypothetical protein
MLMRRNHSRRRRTLASGRRHGCRPDSGKNLSQKWSTRIDLAGGCVRAEVIHTIPWLLPTRSEEWIDPIHACPRAIGPS